MTGSDIATPRRHGKARRAPPPPVDVEPSGLALLRTPLVQLQILLVLAVLLGGGGVAYGMRNLVIQLAAIAILAAHPALVWRFVREAPRMLLVLVLLSMALPLLQIVPLPPHLWQSLPGRELVIESRAIAGLDKSAWVPASVDSARSLVAFCGTLAPAAIIVIGSTLSRDAKARLGWTLVVAALGALALGVAQVSTGNTFGVLYPSRVEADVIYASFANRNSTGLFFVLAMILAMSLPLKQPRNWLLPLAIACALLALGTILTQSRSSMVVLAIAFALVALRAAFAFLQMRQGGERVRTNPALIMAAGFGVLVVIAGVLSLTMGGRASDSLSRFSTLEVDRLEMWDDGAYATQTYWPVGSGMGTFDEVFQVHESLEYVSPRRAGRMHNDHLEVALEAGLAGVLLIAGWLIWIAQASLRGQSQTGRWLRLGAGVGLAGIALQSVLDYPLRNQTLLCVAALLVVLLVQTRGQRA